MKLEIEPVSSALKANFEITGFLFGAIAPKIPTWIATDPKFAKLHNAYVAIIAALGWKKFEDF